MGNSHDGKLARQQLRFRQIVERRQKFAAREVTGGAKDDHDAGVAGPARGPLLRLRKHFRLRHT